MKTSYVATKRNKRCVWTIASKPFADAHFAVYPPELIETPIKAGCPEFVCTKCGTPRQPIYRNEVSFHSGSGKAGNPPSGKWEGSSQTINGFYDIRMGPRSSPILEGYTDCGCGAGFESGVVLDPFMGSGTTAIVALALNRHFIGIELNPDYVQMARRRISQLFGNGNQTQEK